MVLQKKKPTLNSPSTTIGTYSWVSAINMPQDASGPLSRQKVIPELIALIIIGDSICCYGEFSSVFRVDNKCTNVMMNFWPF